MKRVLLQLLISSLIVLLNQYCYCILLCANPDPDAGYTGIVWDFLSAADTTRWVGEPLENFPEQPKVKWLSSYDKSSGILKIEFTKEHQGMKLTLRKPDWFSSNSTKWYRLETRARADRNSDNTIHFMEYLYNGVPPGPTDFNGSGINSVTTDWDTLETYQQSVGGATCMYIQFIIRNYKTSPITLFIDKIIIDEVPPPQMIDYPFEGARFSSQKQTDEYWQYERPIGVDLQTNYTITTGLLDVVFSGITTQGLKMTMGTKPGVTFTLPTVKDKLVGQRATFSSKGPNKDSYFFLATYATDKQGGAEGFVRELGIAARVNRFTNDDVSTLQLVFRTNQPYYYGQAIVKNNAPSHIYLDDLYPLMEK